MKSYKLISIIIFLTYSISANASTALSQAYINAHLELGQEVTRNYENKPMAAVQTSCSPNKQDCRTLDRRYDQEVPYKYSKSFADQFSTAERGSGTCYFIHDEISDSYKIYQDLDRDGVIDAYVPANDNVKVVFSTDDPLKLKVYGITLSFLGNESLGALVNMTFKGKTSELTGILVAKNGPDGEMKCWLSGYKLHSQSGLEFDLANMSPSGFDNMIDQLQRDETCGAPVVRVYDRNPLTTPITE